MKVMMKDTTKQNKIKPKKTKKLKKCNKDRDCKIGKCIRRMCGRRDSSMIKFKPMKKRKKVSNNDRRRRKRGRFVWKH